MEVIAGCFIHKYTMKIVLWYISLGNVKLLMQVFIKVYLDERSYQIHVNQQFLYHSKQIGGLEHKRHFLCMSGISYGGYPAKRALPAMLTHGR